MSDLKHIQALLEKFWEGETTRDEERQLKNYFAAENVDERLKQFTPLFQAIREEQALRYDKPKLAPMRPRQYHWQGWAAAASIALLLTAGAWWVFSAPEEPTMVADKPNVEKLKDSIGKPVQPEQQAVAQSEDAAPKRITRLFKKRPKSEKLPRVNAEEEAAMEEIKAALALVSSKIRKGRQEAAKGAEHLESIDKLFKRKEG